MRAQSDVFAIGYYRRQDLPFLGRAAPMWTTCDRCFCSVLGPTMPNRIALSAGIADRLDSDTAPSNLPTIWDRLLERRVSARYYTHTALDNTVLAVWSPKYDKLVRPLEAFFADARAGKLPAVAYVDPELGASSGPLQDDHPFADIRAGESLMADVYNAIVTGPGWPATLLVINFDEWGGFFDHVPPPRASDSRPDYALRGFRVPALLISPFAPRAHVSHLLFDHASVLRTIEWRWSLPPLSTRDATATNLAAALDFSRPKRIAPLIEVPKLVSSPSC
jgi:phospholipase C